VLCDSALVYEFETIEASVVEKVIKNKGGMEINDENEEVEEDGNNLKRPENATIVLKMTVDCQAEPSLSMPFPP